ncbi:MAG: MiaB/RimO family radical SAM methylthiotransferase, partial [Candidatus Omnitrophica bacterium]|nr:MiaB/RimO family radical SAM methylthiotransferase [Candidatus Omnitrophota bacterium]
EIAKLPELVKDAVNNKITALGNIDGHIPELKSDYRESDKHAYVSIMRGCNNFCSYCIVPYVRGRERSRSAEDIINEIENLVRKGINDITLLGQNVNSYKGEGCTSAPVPQSLGRRYDFVQLLKLINDIDGIKKIRFLTSHPKDACIELFKLMRDCEKMVKHLHLPLQSGSDRILKLMRRGYTPKKYLDLIGKARSIIPELRLTTDVIVGFPGEKAKDFNKTYSLMKKTEFDMAYIFKYSPRSGTKAAAMKDDVPPEVKKERNNTLLKLQKEIFRKKSDEKTKGNISHR